FNGKNEDHLSNTVQNGKVNSEFDLLVKSHEKSTIASQIKNTIKNVLSTIKSTISDSFHKVYQPVKLLGISMGDTIRSGETVAVRIRRANAQAKYRVGDLVQVKSGDITYIHRIVKIDVQFGETIYYTQGDNRLTNPIVDPKIKENQIIGKVHMSKRAIDIALTRIKNGETTIAHALGMTVSPTITRTQLNEKMLDILQTIYGEKTTLEKIKKYLCGDISEKSFKGIESFRPFGQKEFSSQTLNALIHILDLFITHESSQTRKLYYKTFRSEIVAYAKARDIEIKGIDPYHKDWKKLYPEHCYNLILETLGLNVWSLTEFLDDKRMSEWIRHHMDEDKASIEIWKLALVYNLENLNEIPHDYMVGWMKDGRRITQKEVMKVRQELFERREKLLDLIKKDGEIELEEAKEYFPEGTDEDVIKLFLGRRNFLKKYGEKAFFKYYYGENFFRLYQNELFWNSNSLVKEGIIKQ
ncbi:MAG: S26 family signal peptidase, partial [Promethearchaeota archaeon]